MNRALFVVISFSNLGGLLFGFGIAVIAGAMPFLTREFHLTPGMQDWAVNSTLIGCFFGSFLFGRPSDFFGRISLLMGISLLFFFSTTAISVIGDFNFFL